MRHYEDEILRNNSLFMDLLSSPMVENISSEDP
jgi:hypothetical protein